MEKTKIISRVELSVLRITNWVKNHPKEAIILGAILALAAFLRLYKIDQYMTFLGDEGRDAIIVRRLLVEFDPILIGPGTSIGNMYLGPLYYYMMAPALLLAGFSPAGPAIQIAILGIVTVWMIWYIAKKWFGNYAAIVAAGLYAISPTVITYSHSSWNPNIMPFFALLSIWSIWQVWQKKSFKWLLPLGVSFAFVMQSHYLGLLLAPTLGLIWLLSLKKLQTSSSSLLHPGSMLKSFYINSALGSFCFLFLMSPLAIFDARHNWLNFTAMKLFFTQRQTTVSARPWSALPQLPEIYQNIMTRLTTGYNQDLGQYIAIFLVISLPIILWFYQKKLPQNSLKAFYLLTSWLIIALIGLGLYKQNIYDHYFGFIFATPFLLIGGISQVFLDHAPKSVKLLTIFTVLLLAVASLQRSPLRYPPNNQLKRTATVASSIQENAAGNRFNLAVIADRNYEDAYQYFLEKWGTGVTDIDAQRPETTTDQLYVVCELPKDKCDPTHNAKAEVANFGWSSEVASWEISGVTIFKLVHVQDQQ